MDEEKRLYVSLRDGIANLVRPSGGLYYHGKALLNRHRWRPFQDEVRSFLEGWPCPKDKNLILIGPSAGYTLPSEWLKKFDKVWAFDLDPLAEVLFRWRHKHPNVEFHRVNLFWRDGKLSLTPLNEILLLKPTANLLFCNVLGQVLFEGRAGEEEWLGFLRGLRQRLRGRNWASYHDVESRSAGEIVNHLTAGDWTQDLRPRELKWQLSKDQHHQVHAVWETV